MAQKINKLSTILLDPATITAERLARDRAAAARVVGWIPFRRDVDKV